MDYNVLINCWGKPVIIFEESTYDNAMSISMESVSKPVSFLNGEIAIFEFKNIPNHSKRPGLVIAADDMETKIMVLGSTKPNMKWARYKNNVLLRDWKSANLNRETFAYTDSIVNKEDVTPLYSIGKISDRDYKAIVEPILPLLKKKLNENYYDQIELNGSSTSAFIESVMDTVYESINSHSKDSNIFLSEKDIYCNFWPFETRKTHYCFVVGFSGSGKTTLARHLAARYKAEWVELDTIIYESRNHKMTERYLSRQKQRLLLKYIQEENVDLSFMNEIDYAHMTQHELAIVIETAKKFVDWLTTKNTERCVISGLDLIDILPMNPHWYSDPIVFKGTSRIVSMYRRISRNNTSFLKTVEMIPQFLSWYKVDAHGIDYIRNQVISDYNYQERDELGPLSKPNNTNLSGKRSLK